MPSKAFNNALKAYVTGNRKRKEEERAASQAATASVQGTPAATPTAPKVLSPSSPKNLGVDAHNAVTYYRAFQDAIQPYHKRNVSGGVLGTRNVDRFSPDNRDTYSKYGGYKSWTKSKSYANAAKREDEAKAAKGVTPEYERARNTRIVNSPVGRFMGNALDKFADTTVFGLGDYNSPTGNFISDAQAEGLLNLTDEEATKLANSKASKAGQFVGTTAGYVVPAMLTGGMFSQAAGKTIAKPLAGILKGEGKNVFTKAVGKISKPIVNRLAEKEAVKILGKNAPKAAFKTVKNELVEKTATRIATEMGKDLLQDLTIGNAQDALVSIAQGKGYTAKDLLVNNLLNLGVGASMDIVPEAAKSLKAAKNTTDDTLETIAKRYQAQGMTKSQAYKAARREKLAPSGQAMGGTSGRVETKATIRPPSNETLQEAIERYKSQGYPTDAAYRSARRERLRSSGQALGGRSRTGYTDSYTAAAPKETFDQNEIRALEQASPNNVYAEDVGVLTGRETPALAEKIVDKRAKPRGSKGKVKSIYDDYHVETDKESIDEANELVRLAKEELAKDNPNMAAVDEYLDNATETLVGDAQMIDDVLSSGERDRMRGVIKELRNRRIEMPPEVIRHFGDGGWSKFTKEHRLKWIKRPDPDSLISSRKVRPGEGLDTAMMELEELFPEYFPNTIRNTDGFVQYDAGDIERVWPVIELIQDYDAGKMRPKGYDFNPEDLAEIKESTKRRLFEFASGSDELPESVMRNAPAESSIPDNTDEIFDDLRRQDAARAEASEKARADWKEQDSARRKRESDRRKADRKAQEDAVKAIQSDGAKSREEWEAAQRKLRENSRDRAIEQMSDREFMADLSSRGINSNTIRRMAAEQGLSRQKIVDNLYQGYETNKRYADLGPKKTVGELSAIENVPPDKIKDNDFGVIDPTSKEYQKLKVAEDTRSKYYNVAAENTGTGGRTSTGFAELDEDIPWDNGPARGELKLTPEAQEALAETVDEPARIMSAKEAAELQKVRKKAQRPSRQKIKIKTVDSLQPFYDLGKQKGDKSLYVKADHWRSIRKQSNNAIDGNGIHRFVDGKLQKVSKSLSEIYKPVEKLGPDAVKDFDEYVFNMQNTYRYKQGKGSFGKNWTDEDSLRKMKELEEKWGKEKLQTFAGEIHNYCRQNIELQVDSGVITRKHADALFESNPYYVPLHRLMPDEPGYAEFTNNFQAQGGWHKVAQSNLPILNLRDQLAALTRGSYERAAANELGIKLFDTLNDTTIYKKLDDVDLDLEKEFDNMIGVQIKKAEKGADQTKGQPFSADNGFTYTIRQNGDRIQFRIPENMYIGLRDTASNTPKVRGLSDFQNIFRNLVTTWNPLFALVNAMRDFGDALLFTDYGSLKFIRKYPEAWKEMLQKGEKWEFYKARTGATSDFFDIAKQVDEGKWYKKVRNATIGNIEKMNDAFEQVTRFTEWLCAIDTHGLTKEGVDIADNASREISVNFSRGGKIVQTANANGVTFLNAGVQDLVRLKRALTDKKKLPRLIVAASIFGIAPSVINELTYAKDEDYQNLRTTDKDKNYFIKLPGSHKFVKIPKGRVSSMFSIPVQRSVRKGLGNSRNGDAYQNMLSSITDQVAPVNPLTNNIFAPIIQAAQNRTWYNQPIESDYLVDNYLPGQRTDENTTSVATKLGEKLGISPKKIDYVFKQYSGVIGQLLQPALTPGKAANDPKSFASNVLLSRFVVDAVTNNGLSTDFYERSQRAKQMTNSPDATDADVALNDYYTDVSKQLSDYNTQIREVKGDTSITAKEKMEKIQELNQEKNRIINSCLNKEEEFRQAAAQNAESIRRSDFEKESQYQAAIKQTTYADVLDGDEALKLTVDQEKYDKIKAADFPARRYLRASAEAKRYTSGYAKAYVAIQYGATDYDKAKLVDGRISEAQYNKVIRLANSGLSADQIEALTNKSAKEQIDTDDREDGKVYVSKDEAIAYLDSRTDLTREQKAALFASYVSSPKAYNPYE